MANSVTIKVGDIVGFGEEEPYLVGNIQDHGHRKVVRLDKKFQPSLHLVIRNRP